MQTVLVSGATSGIGLCIANELHRRGFRVFGTSRTPEKYADAFPFELLQLDITSDVSIKNCIDTILSRSGVVDVLINNAGIGIFGTAEEMSVEQASRLFETNFWGAVKMTRAILPVMRRQNHGKIITLGSLAGLIGVPGESYYSASKHALEGFFKSLRFEVRRFNIFISVIEPSFFKTNLQHVYELAEPTITDYNDLRNEIRPFYLKSLDHAGNPIRVAKVVLKIIRSDHPRFSYRIGKYSCIAPALQHFCYPFYEFLARKSISRYS